MEKVVTVYPEKEEQVEALREFLHVQKIKFQERDESPYDKAFVEKIKQAEANVKNGDYITIKSADDIWKSILSE